MIILTGDVHQRFSPSSHGVRESELRLAREYVKIAKSYHLKTTLFLTGRSVLESPGVAQSLARDSQVELGGHTFSAFRPKLLHKSFKLFGASHYGPTWYQKMDIQKTLAVFERVLGQRPRAWRTHAYLSDEGTYQLLAAAGFKWVSDKICRACQPYQLIKGLKMVPINVLPDHEHLYHGKRTPRRVAASNWPGDAFGRNSYPAQEWLARVCRQVQDINNQGGIVTLEVHPICMFSLDKFATFRRLCRFLSQFKSGFLSDIR